MFEYIVLYMNRILKFIRLVKFVGDDYSVNEGYM